MHLFPSIDLYEGRVVRLLRGQFDRQTEYAADPLEQALAYARAGASWVHVVDLDGAREGRLKHLEVIKRICTGTSLKVQAGGGARSEAAISHLLGVGVQRVVLGTAAQSNWPWFESLMGKADYHGRIALGLDARNGKLALSGWEQQTEMDAIELAATVSDWPLEAIVYTDIATDGTLAGPNLEALGAVAKATQVPVVASGGVGSLDDLRRLRCLPIAGAIVGRALYEDRMTVEEALAVFEAGQ